MPIKLYINNIAEFDWLIAVEFGRVDDAQPPDHWRGVTDQIGYLHDSPGGRMVGFKVVGFSELDLDDPDLREIWGGPVFDVPMLGLDSVSVGEVILATRALCADVSTINRYYFSAAVATEDPQEALPLWLGCLQAGDSMAHFGLGYTLYSLGRHREAYRHLRHYTEIAPYSSWIWCWFGKAAEAVGELVEARDAYGAALDLEREGDHETEAADRLARILPT